MNDHFNLRIIKGSDCPLSKVTNSSAYFGAWVFSIGTQLNVELAVSTIYKSKRVQRNG